ncbi:MAG TPA: hypothetical protein VF682_00410 [Pseudomonas sp.]
MEFLPVTEKQFDQVRRSVNDTQLVAGMAVKVMERLKSLFAERVPTECWGTSIEQADDSGYLIKTPFGNGRADLVLAVGDEGVYGRLLIRKEKLSLSLKTEYPVVWSIRITADGKVYQGDSLTNPSIDHTRFRREADEALVALGLALIYSIGAG